MPCDDCTRLLEGADEVVREHINHLIAGNPEVAVRLLALLRREAELHEELNDERAVCLCGCPPDQHEIVGRDDGEQCENEDHHCLRVAVGVLAEVNAERAQHRDELRRACERVRELMIRLAEQTIVGGRAWTEGQAQHAESVAAIAEVMRGFEIDLDSLLARDAEGRE